MDIQNNNVTIQINAKDLSGKPLRVSDCDLFIIHIFTDTPTFYLTYSGRDMLATEFIDEITIPKRDMEQLRSGVVQYTYHYLPKTKINAPNYSDGDFEDVKCLHHTNHFHNHPHRYDDFKDDELINSKPVVTSIYWRNIKHNNHPHHPQNGANMNDLDRIHRLLDVEIFNRMKDVDNLNKRLNGEFIDKLNNEIERSTNEDEHLLNLIEALQLKADEIIENANDSNKEVDNKLAEILKNIVDETARAKKAEADLDVKVKQEETARISGDEIIDAKLTMERERAQANEQNLIDRLASVTERFNSFKTIQSEALSSEIERSKSVESSLNEKINNVITDLNAEVARASEKDIEHQNLVETETNRAKAVENKFANDLETEINRAKDAEKHILDEVHSVQDTVSNLATATNVYTKSEVDNKVNAVKNDVDTINNWVNNHNNDVDALQTKVNSIVADVDKAKADLLAEIAKCDAENDKQATELKTLSDSVYNKSEVDSKVNVINSSIASLENWKNNHSDNTEDLQEKVTKLVSDSEKLALDLSTETTSRLNSDMTLQTKVDVAEGKVDAEVTRAKDAEKLISESIAELKENANSKNEEFAEAINTVNANLTLEIARAKANEKINSDAIAIINGDIEVNGSIKKTLADSKSYTDAEIAKLSLAKDAEIADTLKSYATNEGVDKKISEVIGTAPEALDTLGKISFALSQDSDAITAINDVLSGKASSEDVYTKSEIDSKVTAVNNSVSTLETKVDNADSTINGRIDDLVAKVSGIETNVDTNYSTLSDAITAEETTRKAQDKAISDKVDSEVEKLNAKVSDLNAKVIQDIADSTAKDTEIDANISALQTLLSNVETKIDNEVTRATEKDNEFVAKDTELESKITANSDAISSESNRAKQVEKELNDKINSIEIPIVDFTDVNSSISSLDTKVDNAVSSLQTAISNEATTARVAEKANADNITALQTSVGGLNDSVVAMNASISQLSADSSAKDSILESSINTEKKRAENAENALSDKIDVINGDKETVGSIAHAIHDAEHYADDILAEHKIEADSKYQPKGNYLTDFEILSDYFNKEEINSMLGEYMKREYIQSALDEKMDKSEVYSKDEIDDIFDSFVIPSKLSELENDNNYQTKNDVNSAIQSVVGSAPEALDTLEEIAEKLKDNDDAVSVIINTLSEKANSVDVYTKSEVDDAIENVDVTEQ